MRTVGLPISGAPSHIDSFSAASEVSLSRHQEVNACCAGRGKDDAGTGEGKY